MCTLAKGMYQSEGWTPGMTSAVFLDMDIQICTPVQTYFVENNPKCLPSKMLASCATQSTTVLIKLHIAHSIRARHQTALAGPRCMLNVDQASTQHTAAVSPRQIALYENTACSSDFTSKCPRECLLFIASDKRLPSLYGHGLDPRGC